MQPWNAMTHSGELCPMIFTDYLSFTPTKCIAFAKAITSKRYLVQHQVTIWPCFSTSSAVFLPYLKAVSLNNLEIVTGFSEPGPEDFTRIGNSISISVVHLMFFPSY
jgi:hypothetical protein